MSRISFELAKELKEAGWPQNIHGDGVLQEHETPRWETAAAPSLSELIDECAPDDEVYDLYLSGSKTRSEWEAFHADYTAIPKSGTQVEGTTPEEAVARLWLALQTRPGEEVK